MRNENQVKLVFVFCDEKCIETHQCVVEEIEDEDEDEEEEE